MIADAPDLSSFRVANFMPTGRVKHPIFNDKMDRDATLVWIRGCTIPFLIWLQGLGLTDEVGPAEVIAS